MEVRPARPDEYPVVADLTARAYRAVYGDAFDTEVAGYEDELRDVAGRAAGAEVLVAADDRGSVLGAVTYVPDRASPAAEFDADDAAGIRMLAVDPARQGRGVGEALARACLARASAAGRAQVLLHSTEWMTTAHRLYRRLGFARDPARDLEYAPGRWLRAFRLPLGAPPVRTGAAPAGTTPGVLDEKLVPLPVEGRVFRARRRVRLGDADVTGRLRLDACARYLQDLGNDDTADAGADAEGTNWVVRRAVVDVLVPPAWGEEVEMATWCGGYGSRWAERRLSLTGERGGSVEVATLWVHVDVATMAPVRLPESFMTTYAPAAGGRKVTTRRRLGGPEPGATAVPWPLRAGDIDLLGHLNNAAYWAPVDEVLLGGPAAPRGAGTRHPLLSAPLRAVMEYGGGIAPDAAVEVLVSDADDRLALWFTVGGTVDTAALVVPLPN